MAVRPYCASLIGCGRGGGTGEGRHAGRAVGLGVEHDTGGGNLACQSVEGSDDSAGRVAWRVHVCMCACVHVCACVQYTARACAHVPTHRMAVFLCLCVVCVYVSAWQVVHCGLLLPVGVCFLWVAVFGGSSVKMQVCAHANTRKSILTETCSIRLTPTHAVPLHADMHVCNVWMYARAQDVHIFIRNWQ